MSLYSRILLANLLSVTLVISTAVVVGIGFGGGVVAKRWNEMARDNLVFQRHLLTTFILTDQARDLDAYLEQLPTNGTVRAYRLSWPPNERDLAHIAPADRDRILDFANAGGATLEDDPQAPLLLDVPSVAGNGKLVLLTQPLPLEELFKSPMRLAVRVAIAIATVLIVTWLAARHIALPIRYLQERVAGFSPTEDEFVLPEHLSKRPDEVGQLARAFAGMVGRVQDLTLARERLLLDVAHELRSPLTRQMIAVELLRSDSGNLDALVQLEREAERMDALLSDLMQISRAETGGALAEFGPVALHELLEDVLHDVRLEAQLRPCDLKLRAVAPCSVSGCYELLRRAVENVVRNAVRHTAENSSIEITLLSAAEDSVVIRVRDHGPGVADEDLARIFEPFFRTEPARDRATGGSGLGLSITERALHVHGGEALAENACDGGLVITLRLPAASG